MLVVGSMVTESALMRAESRGTHYRADCKEVNDSAWLKQILITRKSEGMKLDTQPVRLPPELQYLKRSLEGIS